MRSHEIGKSRVIKRQHWWTFSSAEQLAICVFPITALDEVLGSDRGLVEAQDIPLWTRFLVPRQPCKRISS